MTGAIPVPGDVVSPQFDTPLDMVGIGYGPANLALAIALDELRPPVRALFLEKSRNPRWQQEMLLPGSDIQHNPIRDLVSLRNPRSRYSFINYLFENGRLVQHLNLPLKFPYRTEYTQYIDWVRRTLPANVRYGVGADSVRFSSAHPGCYDVTLSTGETVTARAISLGPGRTPYVPAVFQGADERKVFHLTHYLTSIARLGDGRDPRMVVVGGSQSAVELALDLTDRFPAARVDLVCRGWSMRAKDHSPFSEEIYFPTFTDHYFGSSESERRRLDAFTRPTNYSAADLDVLERLYLRIYEQQLLGDVRIRVRGDSEVIGVADAGDGVRLTIATRDGAEPEAVCADAVVLATGFRDMGKGEDKEPHHPLLDEVADSFAWTDSGHLDVAADYRLLHRGGSAGPLFLNGLCESTHGIGDAGSFSLLSIRAQVIATSLMKHLNGPPVVVPIPVHPASGASPMSFDVSDVLVPRQLPGPRSAELLDRQDERESNARSYPRHLPFAIDRGEGPYLVDVDGNVYVDFLMGAGVLPLGHSHPELVSVAGEQLGRFAHGLDMPTEVKDEFTTVQLAMLPAGMRKNRKIHFCGPTGANTVDAAIKLAKTATGRTEVLSFRGGFHGTTHLSMSVTGLVDQRLPVGNTVPGVHFAPYSYCSRCPIGLQRSTCGVNCATTTETLLNDENGGVLPPAAVLLELVQGEGGVIPAEKEFITRIVAAARRAGALVIVDEVQTGGGRTGTWFAFEQYDFEPDIICASKSLSGVGSPLGIIIYRDDVDVWRPGAHTGTFRGNQVGFASGVETVRIFQRDAILANVAARSRQVRELFAPLETLRGVREVRGLGLLWGIELDDPVTGAPGRELGRKVQAAAVRQGLVVELGGRGDNVVRILPPLNVTEDVLAAACRLLVDTIRTCLADRMAAGLPAARTSPSAEEPSVLDVVPAQAGQPVALSASVRVGG